MNIDMVNYTSEVSPEKLEAANRQERARQELYQGIPTTQSLYYAMFISAVLNDATFSHGKFKVAKPDYDEIKRRWPFLSEMVDKYKKGERL